MNDKELLRKYTDLIIEADMQPFGSDFLFYGEIWIEYTREGEDEEFPGIYKYEAFDKVLTNIAKKYNFELLGGGSGFYSADLQFTTSTEIPFSRLKELCTNTLALGNELEKYFQGANDAIHKIGLNGEFIAEIYPRLMSETLGNSPGGFLGNKEDMQGLLAGTVTIKSLYDKVDHDDDDAINTV
jgi:hypothetical protein